jgi:hypothetical protein
MRYVAANGMIGVGDDPGKRLWFRSGIRRQMLSRLFGFPALAQGDQLGQRRGAAAVGFEGGGIGGDRGEAAGSFRTWPSCRWVSAVSGARDRR